MSCQGDVVDDRYLVGELLGRGGMAEVFRAIDLAADQDVVAVKLLRSVERGSDRRLAAEAEVLARLDHPGMVRLRGSGTHAGVPYLVLDLADGGSLARDLSAGPVGLDRALDIG
ncbi:MAG TPA: protein kinase, partial [Acidimicrobiales bacterium]|nr:protein kinase [Acidimicrobiales bacterium]